MPDGQLIGPYRLERVLGTGSFATVWLAFDDVLDRKVAVKILADNWSRDHDVRRRFLAEARVLLTVESPRIVRGFHMGETPEGQPYLVMAYADRGTVGDRIDQRRREGRCFDARETVGIATEVAHALVDVHASGHLHRDVKPTNVLIRSSSTRRNIAGLAADETVVLGDFGLARGLDQSALTMVAGSPGYVAPEQAAGLTQLDRRADLYPLGRMMLEMLAGDPGGRATTMAGAATEQIDVASLLGTVPSGPEAPSTALVDVITRLVASNPDERPSSAEEVATTLVGISSASAATGRRGEAPPIVPPSAPPLAPPGGGADGSALTGTQLAAAPRRSSSWWRRPGAVVAGALIALAALVAVVVALTRDGGGGTSGTSTSSSAAPPVLVPVTSGSAVTSAPESSAAGPAGSQISTAAATEPVDTQAVEPSLLVLPEGHFSPDVLSTSPANPDRQEGNILMGAGAFAAALLAGNPDWNGEAPEPDSDGTINFELTGFGRTASVHVEPIAPTSGAEIVGFTIEYT